MFLENHVKEQNQEKAKMIIYIYLKNLLEHLYNHIVKKQEELEELRQKLEGAVSANEKEIDEMDQYIENIMKKGIELENAQAKIYGDATNIDAIQASVDFNFEDDELSRVFDFIKILKNILYDEHLYMSILKYYFQYLIGFDYSIYVLPSCRGVENPDIEYKMPDNRWGGFKHKKRRTNRATRKRKNTNKRTTRRRQIIRKK
jgi:hypothetical protein